MVFITAEIAFIFTSLSAVQIYYFHIFTVVYLNIVENTNELAAIKSFPFTFLSLQRSKYQERLKKARTFLLFFLLKKFYLLASIVNGVTLRPFGPFDGMIIDNTM